MAAQALAADTLIYNQTVTVDTIFSHYDNVEIVAQNTITLDAGFTFSSNGNGSFTANADPWNVEEPPHSVPPGNSLDSTGTLDGSYIVGTINGQPGVSPTGAGTYSIPIEVPPGNKGMVPQLAITYNSQAGNGILGRGWSLSGLSSIVAVGKTRYYDNESSIVSSEDTACRIMWDGQRLLALNSAGLDADSFRTEMVSNVKITKMSETGYEWFEIKTPDGRTLEYGKNTDSRMKLDDNTQWKWMLNKVYDRNGNSIKYSYSNDTDIKSILLSKIEYGGSISSLKNEINFSYTTRDDITYGYIHDDLILNEKLLDNITIESDNETYGKYEFVYDTTSNESLLEGIVQYDRNNYRFNATTISWEIPTFNIDQSPSGKSLMSGSNYMNFTGDFTGDGYSDLVAVNMTSKVYYLYMGSSTGLSSTVDFSNTLPRSHVYDGWTSIRADYLWYCSGSSYVPTSINPDDIENINAGDFDGDGIMELMVEVLEWSPLIPYLSENYDVFNGIDFLDDICYYSDEIEDPGNIVLDYNVCRFINFDIDTSTYYERVRTLKYGPDNLPLEVEMDFCPDILKLGYSPFCIDKRVQYIDDNYSKRTYVLGTEVDPEWMELDGDGYVDYIQDSTSFFHLMLYEPEADSFALDTTINNVFLGSIDLSGDMISAYVALGEEEFDSVSVSLSTLWTAWCNGSCTCLIDDSSCWYDFLDEYGLRSDYLSFLSSECNDNDDSFCWASYYNSTSVRIPESIGRELYIDHYKGRGPRISLGYYMGHDSIFSKAIASDISADGKNELLVFSKDTLKMIFHDFESSYSNDAISFAFDSTNCNYILGDEVQEGDFNGDGIVDLINPATDKEICYVTSGKPGKLVSSIRNGLGIKSRYSYKSLTDPTVYTPENDASFPVIDITAPWYVTSSISSDNGVADSIYMKYDYQGAKIHVEGKGFLGFMRKVVENDLSDRIHISNYSYDTTFFYTYPVSDTSKINGTLTGNSHSYISVDSLDAYQFSVETDSVEVYNNMVNTTTTTSFSYNNDGLVSDKVKNIDDYVTITDKYTYTNAGWHLDYLPEYVSRIYERDGSTETDSLYLSYETSHGNLTQKKNYCGTDRELTTTYSDFDSFGNPKRTATAGKRGLSLSVDSVANTMTYSLDGRFLETLSSPLNHKIAYDIESSTGLPESVTGPNRKQASFEYGPFSRKKKTILPDRIEQASSLYWSGDDTDDKPQGALFYSWISNSSSPAIRTFYDAMGRELRTVTKGFGDETIYIDTQYDSNGRVSKKSRPYFSDGAASWTESVYESDGRIDTINYPDGTYTAYDYTNLSTTVKTGNSTTSRTSKKTINSLGETTESEDNIGNKVIYTYSPNGKLIETSVSSESTHSTIITYDSQGNRTSIDDPDAGSTYSLYDAFGQLVRQITARDDTSTFIYDALGRTTKATDERGDIFYSYISDTTDAAFGMVDSMYNSDNSLQEVYTYDSDYGRLLTETRSGTNKTFTNTYTYDWFGRPITRTYPSDFEIQYAYTTNGNLDQVTGNGLTLWNCSDVNALGQITSYSQGGNSTSVNYNIHGELNGVKTGNIMNMGYQFDELGNLTKRIDSITNQKEEFNYDNLSRLIDIDYFNINGHQLSQDVTIDYDDCGNITSKTGVSSTINYGEDAGPHALTSIENPDTSYYPSPQGITYTCFDKVSLISDTLTGGIPLNLGFSYGLGNQRIKTIQSRNSTVERVKYFDVDYEEDSTSAGLKKYHYIYGGNGLTAIFVMEGTGNDSMHYVLSDHLGSLTTLVNASTSAVQKFSYNSWGIPREADNWTAAYAGELFAGRGYTGHEHLEDFNLINMNGRIYDPSLGRFLSPDPFVQAPGYPNSYNRYSYVFNNPLKYTDPSGYLADPTTLIKEYSNREVIHSPSRWENAPNTISGFGGGSGWGNNWFDIQTDPTGGWWKGPTGEMVNRYTGERMGEGEFRRRYLEPSNISESDKNFVYFGTRYNENLGITESYFGWEITEIPISSSGYRDVTAEFDEQLSNTMIYFSLAKHRFDREFPKDRLRRYIFFRNKVNDEAVFDIKRTSFSRANLGAEYGVYRGQILRYDDFGNYNFGLAARSFGMTLKEALRGAGLNQIRKLDPDFSNSLGYFDHSQDTQLIIKGFFHEW